MDKRHRQICFVLCANMPLEFHMSPCPCYTEEAKSVNQTLTT